MRTIAASSMNRIARPRRRPRSITPGLEQADQELDRGDGADRPDILGEVRKEGERRFLDWTKPELDGWKPPIEVPPGMRFGAFDVDLEPVSQRRPARPALKSVPTHFQLAGAAAVSHPGLAADQGGRRRQGRGDHACCRR